MKNINILIIEDDIEDANFLQETLQKAMRHQLRSSSFSYDKLEVSLQTTVKSALAECQKTNFDIILSDLHLPDSRGLKTVRRLREVVPHTPIIVLSEIFSDELAIEALREGVQDYISKKDLSNTNIIQKVLHAIERHYLVQELHKANTEKQKHIEFKGKFLAQMSHEIRTPMNGVIGMTSVMLNDPDLDQKVRQQIEIIHNSGQNLIALINDILDISKIESGNIKLQADSIDLRHLVENTIKTFSHSAMKKGVYLTNIIEPSVAKYIKTDGARLQQILSNLVSNAIKFTKKGYVCISVKNTDTKGKNELLFEIQDTGRGISNADKDQLFLPYKQIEDNDQMSGTGLGLSICTQLVKMLGGKIGIDSKINQGSVFWFNLPFEKIEKQKISEKRSTLSGKKILLLSKERTDYHNLFSKQLALRGLIVFENHDLATIKKSDQETQPEIIFLDSKSMAAEEIESSLNIIRDTYGEKAPTILMGASHTLADHEIDTASITQSNLYASIALAVDGKKHKKRLPKPVNKKLNLNYKILFVDDGDINRIVIGQILDIIGCNYDSASNGREALELSKENKYDLIFMDIMMPDLSGTEVTRIIKKSAGINAKTPVVALTANAFPEDRKKYLDAGMVDFIAKPADVGVVQSAINKNILKEEGNTAMTSVLDKKTIEMLKSLSSDDKDDHFFQDLIKTYLTETPSLMNNLINSIQQVKHDEIKHLAHKIKGYSRNLGAKKLADLCNEIEVNHSSYNTGEGQIWEQDIKTTYNETLNELKNFIV